MFEQFYVLFDDPLLGGLVPAHDTERTHPVSLHVKLGRTAESGGTGLSKEPDPTTDSDADTEEDPDLDGEESFPASDPPSHWGGEDKEG